MRFYVRFLLIISAAFFLSCTSSVDDYNNQKKTLTLLTASEILGNPNYKAICYSGYRKKTREKEPTVAEIKEDLKLMSVLGIKVLRTYQSYSFPHSKNLLQAITELKISDPSFEMYVLLGAWIECANAWTDSTNHSKENLIQNTKEIEAAVSLANQYSDIVIAIGVGNESMVHWATSYFVSPKVVLKWVNYLQKLKLEGKLSKQIWVTSSDNYASWGGGDSSYVNNDLVELIKSVDYVSVHIYPFHDTYYNPTFWETKKSSNSTDFRTSISSAMNKTMLRVENQFDSVRTFIKRIGVKKEIHIGETGWSTQSSGNYGLLKSRAADEYKQKIYIDLITKWALEKKISCFFFEAFNEPWKDSINTKGSENHFGYFTVDGKAKYLLWDKVDNEVFFGLTRNGNEIIKTYGGIEDSLIKNVYLPPIKK